MLDGLKKKLVDAGLVEADKPNLAESESSDVAAPVDEEVEAPRRRTTRLADAKASPVVTKRSGSAVGKPIRTVASDPEIVATLQEAANASHEQGYDEFKTLYDALDALDEDARIPAALKALAKTQKITVEQVVSAFDHRLELVEAEQQSYEASYQQQVDEQVNSRTAKTKEITDRIAELEEEIRNLEAQRVELAQEAGAAQVELEQNRAVFNASYKEVRSALSGERERIASYIIKSENGK